MIFSKRFSSEQHTRAFVVDTANDGGWQVREEEDDQVVKIAWLHDWHRVETAMMRFAIEAVQLQSDGWTEDHTPASSVV